MSGDGTNNDRMQKLAEKLGRITSVIENEKSTKFEQYEQKCDDFIKEGIKKLGNIPIGRGKHEEKIYKK